MFYRVPALALVLFTVIAAQDMDTGHRLSAALGGINPIAGAQSDTLKSGPLLSFGYGERFFRYGQADVGVDIGFISDKAADRRRNVYIPRFGVSMVIPLMQDRIEASVGLGAAYSFLKSPISDYDTWLVFGQGGVNYALDVDRKYRAGIVVRWYRDPIGRPVQQWITVGGEFTFGFGR